MSEINRFKEKTAVAIITCNREDFLHKALNSIDKDSVGAIYVINAGEQLKNRPEGVPLIQCNRNPTVVGIAKNIALREMKHAGYEFLFLMEDDVVVKNNKVFERYIDTAMDSGLWAGQLSYGTHGGVGGGNVSDDGTPLHRVTVQYTQNKVDLYRHSLHAFVLYHANIIDNIGYMGENYINAAEHLDHFYTAYLKGLGSNFWYFPDIENSFEYLEDIDVNHENSIIRGSRDFNSNFSTSWGIFKEKFQVFPHEITDSSIEEVQERLNYLEKTYSAKQFLKIDNDTSVENITA
jgi:hypothetical protein